MEDKIVVIHQPDFLPYLGFFDRLLKADIYVVFDNVQYVRSSRGWTSRDKIKTRNGEKWLTVSTQKAARDTLIKDILLSDNDYWKTDNLNLIRENYKKCKYYSEIMPYIEDLYSKKFTRMMDFNLESIKMIMNLLNIEIDIVMGSELNPMGKSNELIVDIMKRLNCSKYLSGIGARDYYNPKIYDEAGVEVIWQEFNHPVYPQQFGEFIPYLSSIDLLFNCGIDESRLIIRGTNYNSLEIKDKE